MKCCDYLCAVITARALGPTDPRETQQQQQPDPTSQNYDELGDTCRSYPYGESGDEDKSYPNYVKYESYVDNSTGYWDVRSPATQHAPSRATPARASRRDAARVGEFVGDLSAMIRRFGGRRR